MKFGIITRGERLRFIRKQLELKQDDLSGEDITRNLISMIETGKATLTDKAANVIYGNMKKIVEERRMENRVNLEEIFITEEEQVRRVFSEFLIFVDNNGMNIKEETKKMINLLNIYDMNQEKVKLYKKLGEVFSSNDERIRGYRYYCLANEFAIMSELFNQEHYEIIVELALNGRTVEEDSEVIRYINVFLEKSIDKIDQETRAQILFEKSKKYGKLELYENAIQSIEEVEKIYCSSKPIDMMVYRLMMDKGIYYKNSGYYNKALKMFKKIYDDVIKKDIEDSEYEILSLANLIDVFMRIKEDSKEYFDNLNNITIPESFDEFEEQKVQTFRMLGDIFIKNNKREKASRIYYKAVNFAREKNDVNELDNLLNILLDKAIADKDDLEIEKIVQVVISIIEEKKFKESSKLVMKIIMHFMETGYHSKAKDIILSLKEYVA